MIKNLYDPIYFADVVLIVGYEDCDKYYEKHLKGDQPFDTHKKRNYEGFVQQIERTEKNGCVSVKYIIFIENKKNFYTLLHETAHLVKHIFLDRGIPFDGTNDEAIAFYQTFWFKKLWRSMNKK